MRCRSLHSLCANYQAIIFNRYHTVSMLTLWPRGQLHKKNLIPQARYQPWINNFLWPQKSLMPGLAAAAATSCLLIIWDTFLELNLKQCSSLSEDACPELAWFFISPRIDALELTPSPSTNAARTKMQWIIHEMREQHHFFQSQIHFSELISSFCACTSFLVQNLRVLSCWKPWTDLQLISFSFCWY